MPECGECGEAVDADDKFCPSCGASLSGGAATAVRQEWRWDLRLLWYTWPFYVTLLAELFLLWLVVSRYPGLFAALPGSNAAITAAIIVLPIAVNVAVYGLFLKERG